MRRFKIILSVAMRLAIPGSMLLASHCLPALDAPDSQSQLLEAISNINY
ncbi:hypothetical protein [Leptonema illini]|uniref:Uncharacterized protein n=1 Tax=Leptonema illini DSM 21528 TaxID=929563 RepID=H2CJI6_9LEPT|nr:hypothetical protein [Leptonema illini]EHQ07143.1 hypothetical protein Lepil_2468 [Leptonema illini DSM 21528]